MWQLEFCPVCGDGFTAEEWEYRHSDLDGDPIHEGCCDPCNKCYYK